MTNTAVVVALNGARTATVSVTRESACGGVCDGCHGCADPRETVVVTAVNGVGARPGDRVVIESSTRQTLGLAALVYLLPVALFIIGWVFHPLAGALGALAAAGLVFFVNRKLTQKGGLVISITDYDRSSDDGRGV